jgi:PRC-barrel domain protein
VDRAQAPLQLRVAQAVCGLRFALRAGVLTAAAAAVTLATVALAQGQSSAPEAPKADSPAPESPAPQPPQAAIPPGTPPNATVMSKKEVQGVLGRDVKSATNEDMGHIVDIVVDGAGEPRAAVIDFGGFLGVGSRKVAVDWNALHFTPGDNPSPVTLDLTKDQVKAAPEYAEKKPVVILGAAGVVHPMPQDEPAKPE